MIIVFLQKDQIRIAIIRNVVPNKPPNRDQAGEIEIASEFEPA